jgi:hypothetical protein
MRHAEESHAINSIEKLSLLGYLRLLKEDQALKLRVRNSIALGSQTYLLDDQTTQAVSYKDDWLAY